jgi:LPS export ABC transporter protein LptC
MMTFQKYQTFGKFKYMIFKNLDNQKNLNICRKILIISLFSFALTGCEESQNIGKKEIPKYTGPMVEFDSVHTLYSQDATLRIKLYGNKQIVLQSGDILYPKGVLVNMYNAQGIKTTILKADSGRYEKNLRIYRAYGNVEVVNTEQQQTLYSNQMNWDQNKREIFTEDSIKIVTPEEILYGVGLVSNDEFSKYRIKYPTGVFKVKDNE